MVEAPALDESWKNVAPAEEARPLLPLLLIARFPAAELFWKIVCPPNVPPAAPAPVASLIRVCVLEELLKTPLPEIESEIPASTWMVKGTTVALNVRVLMFTEKSSKFVVLESNP